MYLAKKENSVVLNDRKMAKLFKSKSQAFKAGSTVLKVKVISLTKKVNEDITLNGIRYKVIQTFSKGNRMGCINNADEPKKYTQLKEAGVNDKHNCSVISLAVVTGITYKQAHAAMKKQGRKDNDGAEVSISIAALKALGFKAKKLNPRKTFINKYPGRATKLQNVTTHHPIRYKKLWNNGRTYLMTTADHILGIVNGEVIDHTKGKSCLALSIYEVTKLS